MFGSTSSNGEFDPSKRFRPMMAHTDRPLEPGLAVRMGEPRVLDSGRRATALVTVSNARRGRGRRVVSSLWHLRITGSAGGRARTVGVEELRARRPRTVRLTVPVPRSGRGRICMRVVADAGSARGDRARRCVRRGP